MACLCAGEDAVVSHETTLAVYEPTNATPEPVTLVSVPRLLRALGRGTCSAPCPRQGRADRTCWRARDHGGAPDHRCARALRVRSSRHRKRFSHEVRRHCGTLASHANLGQPMVNTTAAPSSPMVASGVTNAPVSRATSGAQASHSP